MTNKRASMAKARRKAEALLMEVERPLSSPTDPGSCRQKMERELTEIVTSAAPKCGLEKLPPLEP